MGDILPLSMNQTKAKLLEHLNLPLHTYDIMAKETDEVYRWLTSDRSHLKSNCTKEKPPYDWSDLRERSKDEAMERLAKSNLEETRFYWNLAKPTPDYENWIARWFLYKLFRNRDGRNRTGTERSEGESQRHAHKSRRNRHSVHESSSKPSSSQPRIIDDDHEHLDPQCKGHGYYGNITGNASGADLPLNTWQSNTVTLNQQLYSIQENYEYEMTSVDDALAQGDSTTQADRRASTYWDPVRDV